MRAGTLPSLRFLLRATAWGDADDANDAISRVRHSADLALVDPTAAALAEWGQRRFVAALFDPAPSGVIDHRDWPLSTQRAVVIAANVRTFALQRDSEKALAEMESIEPAALAALPHDLYWSPMVWGMASACRAVGAVDHARALYEVVEPFAELCIVENVFMFLGSMHHHLGLLAATFAERARAERHLQQALEVHTRLASPLWTGLTEAALATLDNL